MRITICHLSDIHFATCENTILEKQKNYVMLSYKMH